MHTPCHEKQGSSLADLSCTSGICEPVLVTHLRPVCVCDVPQALGMIGF